MQKYSCEEGIAGYFKRIAIMFTKFFKNKSNEALKALVKSKLSDKVFLH